MQPGKELNTAVNCEELDNLLDTVLDMYYSYE